MLGSSAWDLVQHSFCPCCHWLLFSFLAPLKSVGHFLRQGDEVADSLSCFLLWSLSLQCTVVGFTLAFTIPVHLRGVKHLFPRKVTFIGVFLSSSKVSECQTSTTAFAKPCSVQQSPGIRWIIPPHRPPCSQHRALSAEAD